MKYEEWEHFYSLKISAAYLEKSRENHVSPKTFLTDEHFKLYSSFATKKLEGRISHSCSLNILTPEPLKSDNLLVSRIDAIQTSLYQEQN